MISIYEYRIIFDQSKLLTIVSLQRSIVGLNKWKTVDVYNFSTEKETPDAELLFSTIVINKKIKHGNVIHLEMEPIDDQI